METQEEFVLRHVKSAISRREWREEHPLEVTIHEAFNCKWLTRDQYEAARAVDAHLLADVAPMVG